MHKVVEGYAIMQRFSATNFTTAVNNSQISASAARDTGRTDASSLATNFSVSSRRQSQSTPYKLKCDTEPLNSRLGPPDFHPQSTSCPEETLTKDYVQFGYRETVDGIEEARETSFSQVQNFTKSILVKCKESIRKNFRAINESRSQKRKAGQVYGVPFSGSLLVKPGLYPEQRPCGEDFRRKWIEGLSQSNKRLRCLTDHVPHGYRKKTLFEVFIRNNVPLLRSTWFVKVTYLNQIRPGSSSTSISSGATEKGLFSRTELWTKDVIDYMQSLVDEFFSVNNSRCNSNVRDQSSHVFSPALFHGKNSSSTSSDGDEPSLHFRWWYMVRMLQWHCAEGLILPSYLIDWIFNQLEDKELIVIMQLLLPLIYGVVEHIILSQTYVRVLVRVAVRFFQEPLQGGRDLVNNSRRTYTTSAVVELLQYLLLAVPDTFVCLPSFSLPTCVGSSFSSHGDFSSKAPEDVKKMKNRTPWPSFRIQDKALKAQHQCCSDIVSSIQRLSYNFRKSACHGYPRPNVAKVVNAFNYTLQVGDLRKSHQLLFDDLFDGSVHGNCLTEVSSCIKSSLKWIACISLPFVFSVFLVCDWATSFSRNLRTALSPGPKFTGRGDFSEIYIAVRLLNSSIMELEGLVKDPNGRNIITVNSKEVVPEYDNVSNARDKAPLCFSNIFRSPGPLHDILVCWIDQHDACKGDTKCLQLLIIELVRSGIFSPQAYIRQLIVSGMVNGSGPLADTGRWIRHYQVLKMLPRFIVKDCLQESKIAEGSLLEEIMHVYANERRFVLRNLTEHKKTAVLNASFRSEHSDGVSSMVYNKQMQSTLLCRASFDVEGVKSAIAAYLQLPKLAGFFGDKAEPADGVLTCEDCKRGKRPKVNDERTPCLQGHSPNLSDEEDAWWARKGQLKPFDCFKTDPFPKTNKPAPKGRQKTMRKTQSLSQLATARIESSQGASTSHLCDNRISCPHHKSVHDVEDGYSFNSIRSCFTDNIGSIGKVLKQMKFVKKRKVSKWLISAVKELLTEIEKTGTMAGQTAKSFSSIDEKTSTQWRFGEPELLAVLYFMDLCDDVISASKFLFWLLLRVPNNPSSSVHGGRNVPSTKTVENSSEVGDAFLLSSIKRYENVLAAADLIPEILSAMVNRIVAVMSSSGKVTCSSVVVYVKYLLKKYNSIPSVTEWEKTIKDTSSKRLLSELEYGRSLDMDTGFPFGIPPGIEDIDDYLRQKINAGRLSRLGLTMRDVVQRHIDEALHYFTIKERKQFAANGAKCVDMGKSDEGYKIAKQIIAGLIECIRQTGGAAQEGDPSLVCSAVSAIVGNVGPALAKVPDSGITQSKSTWSMNIARCLLHIHITCLCLLKEVLGERHSRAFEIALAMEATSALATAFVPSSEAASNPGKLVARTSKITSAISSLVVGIIVYGVVSLERMITVLRLKEGLDLIHFVRNARCNPNGNTRAFRVDTLVEVCVHWFRILVGNLRSICDGLIVELLGEQYAVAFSRLQRALPLSLILPPAYSIFAFVLWRPFLFSSISSNVSDDLPQLFQSSSLALVDTIKHQPFRDACMRNMHLFYDIISSDTTDAAFASILERSSIDPRVKEMTFIPLRARMFLDSIVDCKISIHIGEFKLRNFDTERKLMDKLVQSLDLLEPTKFHWQWVELRLLLNEQAVMEKLKAPEVSLVDAIASISSSLEKTRVLENENNFIEIILTRLLIQPDAALLFSELLHMLGRSLEDSLMLQVKWFLGGPDVLYGRMSVKQRLMKIAEKKGLSTDVRYSDKIESRKTESVEEGEVVEETMDCRKEVKGGMPDLDDATERALVELLLPCIDRSSEDSRCTFANDLIKQLSSIEQHINAMNRAMSKLSSKGSYRKLARQAVTTVDSAPPSPAALRASIYLRLQLLLRLFPTICGSGEPSMQGMRHMLASVITRLLGTRVVQETGSIFGSADALFDWLLLFLHALLGHLAPSWMKFQCDEYVKNFSRFSREAAENLQNELDHMQLPDDIRWRIQSAMPIPPPLSRRSISCLPLSIPIPGINVNSVPIMGSGNTSLLHRNLSRSMRTATDFLGKTRQYLDPDPDPEMDPWMLLEDGAGSALSSNASVLGSSDNAIVKASCWLKGAIRVRRSDLRYVGPQDDDS